MPRPKFIRDKVSFGIGVIGFVVILPSVWLNVRRLENTVDLFFFVVLVLLSSLFFFSLVTNSIGVRRRRLPSGRKEKKKDRYGFHNE